MDFLKRSPYLFYMDKPKPVSKFIDYFSRPLTPDQISYLNNLNAVTIEKVELYRDFTISLAYIICSTYLGDDVIFNEDQINVHFNWCWNKVITDFEKEKILFKERGEHYYYHFNYFMDVFYNAEVKDDKLFDKIYNFWSDIISIDKIKTRSEYDIFIELYKVQNKYFHIKS
jgi:hypothetical protein